MGASVMRRLFESGHFEHLLERIFFLLEPDDLRRCSEVCTGWRDFLDERVWNTSDGAERIR